MFKNTIGFTNGIFNDKKDIDSMIIYNEFYKLIKADK